MGLLSPTVSVTRYRVDGKIEGSAIESVYNGLKNNTIGDIDGQPEEHAVGWTAFDTPYGPNFEGSSFIFGTNFVFALRIDKKSIPPKVVEKHLTKAAAERMAKTGRDYLPSGERQDLKDQVVDFLCRRIPATPNPYDVIWDHEAESLWMFTTVKAANEALQTLFAQSFNLNLIRLFPYTMAEFTPELTHLQRDALSRVKPTRFTE